VLIQQCQQRPQQLTIAPGLITSSVLRQCSQKAQGEKQDQKCGDTINDSPARQLRDGSGDCSCQQDAEKQTAHYGAYYASTLVV
jgi:hypothetical protein